MNIYEGNENYIFVSYAHKDAGIVLPILEALDKAEFRIWFDSGIETGSEWPAYVEQRVKSCCRMIYFVTNNSVNSRNCRNEVNLAISKNKEIVVAYLENVELSNGLDLQLSTNQSVYRNRFTNNNDFTNSIIRARILSPCKITNTAISNEIENNNRQDNDKSPENLISLFRCPPDKKETYVNRQIRLRKRSKARVMMFSLLLLSLSLVGVVIGIIVYSYEIGQWLVGISVAIAIITITIIIRIAKRCYIPQLIVNLLVSMVSCINLFTRNVPQKFLAVCFMIGLASAVAGLISGLEMLIVSLRTKPN